MDTVCVIVLASNGNGGHKIVSEPLWGSAGPPFKRSCAGLSTSSSLLIHHLTSTSSNLHIESMDPLHTALAGDLMFRPYVPRHEEDNTVIWPETTGHAQSSPEFSLGGATTVSAVSSGDMTGSLLTFLSYRM